MASETELDRLVVRLVGDGTSFQKMIAESQVGLKKQAAELERTEKSVARYERKMADASRIIESTRTPLVKYRRELATLRGHFKAGRLSQETFNRALSKLQLVAPKTAAQLNAIAAAQKKLALQTELATQSVARQDRRLRSASGITASVRTQTELYKRQVVLLRGHLRAGRISQETYNRAMLKAQAILPPTIALTAKLSTSLKAVGASATTAGLGLLKLTAPLAIIGFVSVKSFASFNKAMIESTSIMKVTVAQTERMRDVALELSGRSIQGPTDLAKSYFFLASAGLDAEQSMAALPVVTRFATAGAFDMALATDLLTDAQSALGLTVKDTTQNMLNMTRISDVLVKANTLANASVEQFATALTSKAGASLKVFNKSVEEGVAVLAAFADQGVKAELAGNALDRIIRLLAKSSMVNAKAHEELGFKVFDTAGKMRNLGSIIANLENILEGMSDQQKVATLAMLGFEARVQQVILPLLGTSKAIKQYEKELRKAGGTTADVADKQMKSFANQMKMVKNQVTVTAIAIGQELAPVLLDLVESMAPILEGVAEVVRENKTLVKTLGKVTIAVVATGVALVSMGAILTVLSGPLGVIVLAVGALTATYVLLSAKTKEYSREAQNNLDAGNKLRASTIRQFQELENLGRETELTKDEQETMLEIVNALNDSYPELGLQIDKVTGKVKDLGKAQAATNKLLAVAASAQVTASLAEVEANLSKARFNLKKATGTLTSEDVGIWARAAQTLAAIPRASLASLGIVDVSETLGAEAKTIILKISALKAQQRALEAEERAIKAGTSFIGKDEQARVDQDAKDIEQAIKDAADRLIEVEKLVDAKKQAAKLATAQEGLKELDRMTKRGARLIEQFATPAEVFEKTLDDLIQLLEIGALGKGAKGELVFEKALAEAQKKFDDTTKSAIRLKEAIDDLTRPITGTIAGTAQAEANLRAFRSIGRALGVEKENVNGNRDEFPARDLQRDGFGNDVGNRIFPSDPNAGFGFLGGRDPQDAEDLTHVLGSILRAQERLVELEEAKGDNVLEVVEAEI